MATLSPPKKRRASWASLHSVRWGLKGEMAQISPSPRATQKWVQADPPSSLLSKSGVEGTRGINLSLFLSLDMPLLWLAWKEGRRMKRGVAVTHFLSAALITRKACRVSETHNTVVASSVSLSFSRKNISDGKSCVIIWGRERMVSWGQAMSFGIQAKIRIIFFVVIHVLQDASSLLTPQQQHPPSSFSSETNSFFPFPYLLMRLMAWGRERKGEKGGRRRRGIVFGQSRDAEQQTQQRNRENKRGRRRPIPPSPKLFFPLSSVVNLPPPQKHKREGKRVVVVSERQKSIDASGRYKD